MNEDERIIKELGDALLDSVAQFSRENSISRDILTSALFYLLLSHFLAGGATERGVSEFCREFIVEFKEGLRRKSMKEVAVLGDEE